MSAIVVEPMELSLTICIVSLCASVLAVIWSLGIVRAANKEHRRLNREMFGLVRKIEGMTSHKREQVLHHFDKLVETLANRIPTLVAAEAGEKIFETESAILRQLAELQPQPESEEEREKLDMLIKNMEALESTVVAHTASAVHQVMQENRRVIFEEEPIPLPIRARV